jgi:equilibrative nucleoside transporter 1/2/3
MEADSEIVISIPSINISINLEFIKYGTFLLCGVASLWPWNCFLSASDYFQDKLSNTPELATNYSSAMMTISTLTSAIFNYYLSTRQHNVNYAKRLKIGNYLQMLIFLIMIISVKLPDSWTLFYFGFVMMNVFATSIGSCLTQVGMMAMCNVQSSTIYANATVVGNAIAGVLPSIAMMIAVIFNPKLQIFSSIEKDKNIIKADRSNEAIKYFLTSIFIAFLAQVSIWVMEYYEKKVYIPDLQYNQITDDSLEERLDEVGKPDEEFVGFKHLWGKLKYVESTIILTFSLTLIFPVFASNVESNSGISKDFYVPLAFFIWNIGDLIGRLVCAIPFFLIKQERLLIIYSTCRVFFIPAFLMCNIKNKGGMIGDFGYMIVQLLFGFTNGQLFSSSYMRVGELLDTGAEKKAAAAFTALLINLSLLAGSLASFLVVYFFI